VPLSFAPAFKTMMSQKRRTASSPLGLQVKVDAGSQTLKATMPFVAFKASGSLILLIF